MVTHSGLNGVTADAFQAKFEVVRGVAGDCLAGLSPKESPAAILGVCIWQAACVLGDAYVASRSIRNA